MLIESQKYNKM